MDHNEGMAKIEAAQQMVSDLNHRRREWYLSIPARPDNDPDLIIHAGLDAGAEALRELAQLWQVFQQRIVGVLEEVVGERQRQDEQWGGPAGADQRMIYDWVGSIQYQLDRLYYEPHRPVLIRVAALAVAAVESLDRQAGLPAPTTTTAGDSATESAP